MVDVCSEDVSSCIAAPPVAAAVDCD
jgi:hypothetical protein